MYAPLISSIDVLNIYLVKFDSTSTDSKFQWSNFNSGNEVVYISVIIYRDIREVLSMCQKCISLSGLMLIVKPSF